MLKVFLYLVSAVIYSSAMAQSRPLYIDSATDFAINQALAIKAESKKQATVCTSEDEKKAIFFVGKASPFFVVAKTEKGFVQFKSDFAKNWIEMETASCKNV